MVEERQVGAIPEPVAGKGPASVPERLARVEAITESQGRTLQRLDNTMVRIESRVGGIDRNLGQILGGLRTMRIGLAIGLPALGIALKLWDLLVGS